MIPEFEQAATNADLARTEERFVSLPENAMRFGAPGTELYKVVTEMPLMAAANLAERVLDEGIDWETLEKESPEDPDEGAPPTMAEYDEKMAPYLKLLKEYLAGTYDPAADVVGTPAQ